ncbi:MAG: hypothetical protein ACFFFG_11375 [Candidatus Thorarchaeota archaeon]
MKFEQELLVFRRRYDDLSSNDYSSLFRLVTDIVATVLKKSRAGIMLGLLELGYDRGRFVGGFHKVGTNEIYLNKSALRVMKGESPDDFYKAYLFHLLLHEYIHATGVYNESKTRQLTRSISLAMFDTRHPVGRLVVQGLNALFPYGFHEDRYVPSPEDVYNPEYILLRHRDSELTYI